MEGKKFKIGNFPLLVNYILFPIVSIILSVIASPFEYYDYIWSGILFYLILLSLGSKYKRVTLLAMSIVIVILVSKYLAPICIISSYQLRPLIMDGKWIVYLSIGLLWVKNYGGLKDVDIYYYGRIYTIIYIGYSIIFSLYRGILARVGLLSEANYDCFLFLISFCFIRCSDNLKRDIVLYLIAVIFSGSQTGLISFIVLNCFIFWTHIKKFIILLFPLIIWIVIQSFLIRRGSTDLSTIDRFVFFAEAISFFSQNDILTFLFGHFPGESMNYVPSSIFDFYIQLFEDKNNIIGCFPFYFHSTYIRLAITWGVPILVVLLYYTIKLIIGNYTKELKSLTILIFLQSISLSSLTLSCVSPLLFIIFISLIKSQRQIYNLYNHPLH